MCNFGQWGLKTHHVCSFQLLEYQMVRVGEYFDRNHSRNWSNMMTIKCLSIGLYSFVWLGQTWLLPRNVILQCKGGSGVFNYAAA